MNAESKEAYGILDTEQYIQTSPFTGKKCIKKTYQWLVANELKLNLNIFLLTNMLTGKPVGNESYNEYIDINSGDHYLIKIKND